MFRTHFTPPVSTPFLPSAVLKRTAACAAALLCLAGGAASEAEERPETDPPAAVSSASRPPSIRVGMMAFTSEGDYSTHVQAEDFTLRQMDRLLNEKIPQYTFDVRFYRMAALQEAVKNEEVDLFLASSGFFWEMQRRYGARDLATIVTAHAPNPNHGVAGVIFVRKDRGDLRELPDLRRKTLAAGRSDMFLAYQLSMGEIAAAGIDPDRFFSRIDEHDLPAETVVGAVLKGEADVGFLRACVLEYRYPDWRSQLRIISPKPVDELACAHSSALYPNWTIGATDKVPPDVLKQVAGALLSLPAEHGISWSLATDFKHIDRLEEDLRIGRYAYLKDWSWSGIWRRFHVPILCAAAALLALLLHLVRVERLVAKRTAALTAEMARRQELEEEAERQRDRVEQLERTQIVGQLSTLIAHDLKQPLAAAGYFSDGLLLLLRKGRLDPEKLEACARKIRSQIERMSAIVEQVRRYAKREDRRDERLELKALLEKSLRESRVPEEIEVALSGSDVIVKGCRLELEAAFMNLIRNAAEAQKPPRAFEGEPFIRIRWHANASLQTVEIRFENNGRVFSAEDISRMREPLSSSKPDGLGLGLEIVRSVAEAHAGDFTLEAGTGAADGRNSAAGITAIVALPLFAGDGRTSENGENSTDQTSRKE